MPVPENIATLLRSVRQKSARGLQTIIAPALETHGAKMGQVIVTGEPTIIVQILDPELKIYAHAKDYEEEGLFFSEFTEQLPTSLRLPGHGHVPVTYTLPPSEGRQWYRKKKNRQAYLAAQQGTGPDSNS